MREMRGTRGTRGQGKCPILLFLGCANDFATSTLLYETLRERQSSGQRVAQYKSVQVPNAHFQDICGLRRCQVVDCS